MTSCLHILLRTTATLVALLLFFGMCANTADPAPGPQRLVYNAGSPPWLAAVGKLHVPVQIREGGETNAYVEDCSATLVARARQASTDIVVTAWHCLEHYRDLSKDIVFTLNGPGGEAVQHTAVTLASGGDMGADWAILRLNRKIPASVAPPIQLLSASAAPNSPLVMAGFSRDVALGRGGQRLTYDPNCTVTGGNDKVIETSCMAHRGASGGAVVQMVDGEPRFSGVISAGNGVGVSHYIPLTQFRRQLSRFLR